MSVREVYAAALAERGYQSDPAQLRALDALARCESEWADYKARRRSRLSQLLVRPPIPRGVYMHGGVGRGKSFLMDCFFNAVPLQRKTRLHFHEFLREVHRELADLHGTRQPAASAGSTHFAALSADLLRRISCCRRDRRDDPAPAARFDVREPRQHRHHVELPPGCACIRTACTATASCRRSSLLKQQLEVVDVDAGIDYRALTLAQVETYLTPLGPAVDAQMTAAFERLAEAREEDPVMRIEQRRAAGTAQGRRCGLVRFSRVVRRPALAKRLS